MFLYELIHDASLLPDSKTTFMHVSVLMLYTHPRSVTTSRTACIFTHNPARISTVYRLANNLVFDLAGAGTIVANFANDGFISKYAFWCCCR